jgi:large subunit ribosomal protein L25
VSITGLPFGTQITAGDITLPTGSTLITDPEQVVIVISEAPTEAEMEAEMAEAAEELGIVEDQPDAPEGAEGAGGEAGDGESSASSGE